MRKAWIGIVGAAMLATFAAVVAVRAYSPGFDPARWQAQRNSEAHDNPRGAMVSDLMQRLHPGMTRSEVLALLGEPETQDGARFTYALGASAYGIDYEFFVIEFDGDGRLVRHALTRG